MITRKNIMVKKVIPGRDKPMWLQVGTLTQFDNGGQVIELNHLPGIQYSVFEPREESGKYEGNQPRQAPMNDSEHQQQSTQEADQDFLNNIPF